MRVNTQETTILNTQGKSVYGIAMMIMDFWKSLDEEDLQFPSQYTLDVSSDDHKAIITRYYTKTITKEK